MRKNLLLLVAALIMPVLAFAVPNKALTIDRGAYNNVAGGSNENLLYVDYTALGWEQAATPGEGANFSIGMWFKTTGILANDINAGVLMRLGTGDHNNTNGAIQLIHRSNGKLSVNLGGDNTGGQTGWSFDKSSETGAQCGTAALNEWHYLLLSFNSTTNTLTAYLDGTQTAQATAPGVFGYKWEDGVFAFGGYLWSGLLDEVQMYNAALTAEEAALAYNNRAKSISSLTALYDFNAVKAGTTGQFESAVGANVNPASFENSVYNNWWAGGVVYRASHTEQSPTLVDGRVVDYTFTVPAASDFENIAELTFVLNGETLNAGDEVSVSVSDEITINVVAASGYQVAGITVAGEPVENGGTFTLSGDTTKDDIVITLAQGAHALTVVNTEELAYTLTTTAGAEVDFTQVLEGAELRLVVTVPEDKVLNAVRLGDEVLTANAQGAYVFTMPGADVTLTIDATPKAKYTVTYAQPQGGVITVTKGGVEVASGTEVLDGTVLNVTATPSAGYSLVALTANGTEMTASEYTVTADVTFAAEFEEGIDYCVPAPVAGRAMGLNTSYSGRGLTSVNVTCGDHSVTVAGQGTTGTRAVYADHTDIILTIEPGETVTMEAEGAGTWMNTFVFVDFNRNGFTNEDRVYVRNEGANAYAGTATFVVPSDIEPGKYRVRYMVDWDGVSPCQFGQSTSDNGEVILDFLLMVPSQDYDTPRTITVASANDLGTVAFTNPATDELTLSTTQKKVFMQATANEGAAFMNWTDAEGNVVSESATYIYEGAEDATFTANFGYVLNVTVKGEGKVELSANDLTIANGTVLLPATEVTVATTPAQGKALISVSVNGEMVSTAAGVATVVMNSATEVIVEFGDKQLSFEYTVSGNGTVYACNGIEDGEDELEGLLIPGGAHLESGSPISTASEVFFFLVPNKDEEVATLIEMEGDVETDVTGEVEEDEFALADGTLASLYSKYGFQGDYSLTVTFTTKTSAIDSIAADAEAGEIEFFNLQGVKVGAGNLTPGIYVVRHGSTTAKVLVK